MSHSRNWVSAAQGAQADRERSPSLSFLLRCAGRLTPAAAVSCLALLAFAADPGAPSIADPARSGADTNALATAEAEQCRTNLTRIHTAIRAYQAENKKLPDWLSDLVPKYIDDLNVLTCPVTRRTGRVNNFGLADPKLPTSYLFEFCNVPVPTTIGGGSTHTMREWKEKQAELVGDVVPLVRCHQHNPQLSVTLGGALFENTGSWENMFTNKASPTSLSLGKIFPNSAPARAANATPAARPTPAYQPPAIIRIPPRDPQAPSSLIDLTDYYNAGLNEGWHHVPGSTFAHSDLAWLPKGIQSFAGTDFDVRGVIQLAGRSLNTQRFPPAVKGIRVNRKCSALHFLHSTGWSVPEGTRIGHYRVVYAGGDERQIPIAYGLDVRDWHLGNNASPGPDPTNSVVAWMGKSPATQAQGVTLRLFKTSWENPLANLRIETVDYVSAMTNCAPFLIAITAE